MSLCKSSNTVFLFHHHYFNLISFFFCTVIYSSSLCSSIKLLTIFLRLLHCRDCNFSFSCILTILFILFIYLGFRSSLIYLLTSCNAFVYCPIISCHCFLFLCSFLASSLLFFPPLPHRPHRANYARTTPLKVLLC